MSTVPTCVTELETPSIVTTALRSPPPLLRFTPLIVNWWSELTVTVPMGIVPLGQVSVTEGVAPEAGAKPLP